MVLQLKFKSKKIKELQSYLKKNNIDFALLEKIDAKYFTGINADCILIIPSSGKTKVFMSSIEIDNYKIEKNANYKLVSYDSEAKKVLFTKVVALNYASTTLLTASNLKNIKRKDISNFLMQLRQIKTTEELKNIRKACDISQKIFDKTIKQINKTLFTEVEIKQFLLKQTIENNCSKAFYPIVASGRNAAIPHAISDNKKLRKGFLVIDYGVKYNGYCSDITRTVYIGKPSKKEIELYDLVLSIQKDSIKKVKDLIGKKTKILDSYAREKFGKFRKEFTHTLGHGFGLEIHEAPFIAQKSDEILQQGQIITIEPGIYNHKKAYGIRIEDDILVKDGAVEVLTRKLNKKLIIIDYKI